MKVQLRCYLYSRHEHADIWFSTAVSIDIEGLTQQSQRKLSGWQQIVLTPSSPASPHKH